MAQIAYNELRPGTIFLKDGQPYECLEYQFVRMQQRKPVAQLKIKNLLSGKVVEYTAHQTDIFEEAEIEKQTLRFLYSHKEEFWFCVSSDPKQRFSLKEEQIGSGALFIKQNTEVTAQKLEEKILSITLPAKVELKVTESPPAIKGDTAQGGTKLVTLETGAKVNVPLFINEGDVVRINTTSGEYSERVEKSK